MEWNDKDKKQKSVKLKTKIIEEKYKTKKLVLWYDKKL